MILPTEFFQSSVWVSKIMVERNWRIGTFFMGDSAGSMEETVGN